MNKDSRLIDRDLLEAWQQNQATRLIWRKLLQDYNPWAALLTCSKEDLGKYQGQAAIMEVLKTYFEGK